jgi:hypothetical protein
MQNLSRENLDSRNDEEARNFGGFSLRSTCYPLISRHP